MRGGMAPSRYARKNDMAGLGIVMIFSRLFQEWMGGSAGMTGTAFWQAMLLAAVIGAAYCAVLAWAMKDEPLSLFAFVGQTCGKPGVVLMALAVGAVAFSTCVNSMGTWLNLSAQEILARTPAWVVVLMGMLPVAGFGIWGLPIISRTARFFLPVLVVSLAALVFFVNTRFEISRIFPLWGYGAAATLSGGVRLSGMFADAVFLCLFGAPTERGKGWRLTALIGGALAVCVAFLYIVMFSFAIPETPHGILQVIPKMADTGEQIPMMQALTIVIWVVSLLLASAASLTALSTAWCAVFDVPDARPVMLCMALIIAYPLALTTGKLPYFAYMGPPWWLRLGAMALGAAVLVTARIRRNRLQAAGGEARA